LLHSNGIEVHKEHPSEIIRAQKHIGYDLSGIEYCRVKYGYEIYEWQRINADVPCHNCGILKGQYHTDGCDVEQCSKYNAREKLYDFCIPKECFSHNLFIIIVLEMDRLGSYLLRRNLIKARQL